MKKSALLSSLLLSLMLTACGGGGGGGGDWGNPDQNNNPGGGSPTTTNSTAQGFYSGTTSSGYELKTLVLENDHYWSLYGYTVNGLFDAYGVLQGSGTANNGSFTSTNLRNFDFNGVIAAYSLSASYQTGASLNGSITDGTGTITFASSVPLASTYNYNMAANLGNLAGAWPMTDLDGYGVTLNIAANGTFSGSSGGCNFSGTLAPRASGKNVFDLALVYGGAPCPAPNQAQTGIAVEYLVAGGRQLLMASVDSSRSRATGLVGVR
ncbi:MAG TPA: hypothetical protein VFF81_06815 [Noviherbaspirillum sp.]|nr:hypothetical protein [Noviherbaspirillum sp.]